MKTTIALGLAGGLMALLVAGCGALTGAFPTARPAGSGASLPPGAVPTSSIPATVDACALLTDDDVTAGTGEPVASRVHSTLTQVFPSVCDIELEGGGVFGGNGSLTISALGIGGRQLYEQSFEPFVGEENFLLDEKVQGLGDKAARSSDQLMVLKDDVLFELFFLEPGRQDKQQVEQYLAQIILGRLGCLASGCPGVTAPPALNTPRPSATEQSLLGGQLTPANEHYRVVNVYSDEAGPTGLDVYGWDAKGHAYLLTTVDYGQASPFFDPGIGTDDIGDTGPHLSFTRHGAELLPFAFNLSDYHDDPAPGSVATIVAAPGDTFAGSRDLGTNFLYEQRPDRSPIASALPDSGVLRVNTDGLTYTGDARFFFLSVGTGCLGVPDYPDVPLRVGGGLSAEGEHQSADGTAVIPAGSATLTIHPDAGVQDFRCDNTPATAGIPVQVAKGQRLFLVLYRTVGDAQLKALVVPFAEGVPQ